MALFRLVWPAPQDALSSQGTMSANCLLLPAGHHQLPLGTDRRLQRVDRRLRRGEHVRQGGRSGIQYKCWKKSTSAAESVESEAKRRQNIILQGGDGGWLMGWVDFVL